MVAVQQGPLRAGGEPVSPLAYSVPDARSMLGGMGNTWFYAQVKAGRIRTVKLGSRTLVPASELVRFVAEIGLSPLPCADHGGESV